MSKIDNAYGHILGSGGYDNTFSLTLTDDDDNPVTGIDAVLTIGRTGITGVYDEENECYWFTIPSELAEGEYFYNITVDGETLMFPQKITFL